jgi:hypothetical protein
MGQQVVEELKVALAVEDHHRDLVPIVGRSDTPLEVLGDDVPQQGRLAGAGLAEHDTLHHPDLVRPQPRLAVDVVSEDDGALCPGSGHMRTVFRLADDQRRMPLGLFPPGSARQQEIQCR